MEDKTRQKRKVKLIYRGAWNSLMAWPDWLWPQILRQIYDNVLVVSDGDLRNLDPRL